MRILQLGLLLLPVTTMAKPPGTLTYSSAFDVATTIDRVASIATAKGLQVFTRIDFAHDAHAAGLQLRDEQLLIFGNPKAGTPLLEASPSVGLDLPLKVLAYQDANGATVVVINEPAYIVTRHAVSTSLEANIKGIVALVTAATTAEKTP